MVIVGVKFRNHTKVRGTYIRIRSRRPRSCISGCRAKGRRAGEGVNMDSVAGADWQLALR